MKIEIVNLSARFRATFDLLIYLIKFIYEESSV